MMPCFKRTNFKHLVSGYCRTHFETRYTPDTIADLILSYYPQFHGTTFEWKISNNYITEQLKNLVAEENEDPRTKNSVFFDSDVFDVGLPNRFFLRLWANDKSQATTTCPHGTNKKKRNNTTANNNNSDEKSCDFIISLKSFPLTSKISNVIFHTELYLHRIRDVNNLQLNLNSHDDSEVCNNTYNNTKQHSTIWKIVKTQRSSQGLAGFSFNWVVGDSKRIINFLGGGKGSDLKFVIECKIKILRIYQDSIYYLDNYCSSLEKIHPIILSSNDDRLKFRFSWIVNSSNTCVNNDSSRDNGDDGARAENRNNQVDHEYHSGIFYDMFQLQCNNKGEFSLMICGLPYKTHKMGIKCGLYVKYNDFNFNNKIRQVVSTMITFDYDNLTKHYFCKNTNDRIKDLLFKYNSVTLICEINVIQRYNDKNNELITIKTSSKTTNINKPSSVKMINKSQSVVSNSICNNVEMEEKYYEKYIIEFPHLIREKQLSSNKVVSKFDTDIFIWCVDNFKIINDLSHYDGTTNLYESEIFKLHKHGWSLSIGKETRVSKVLIRAWCLCAEEPKSKSKSSKSKSNKTSKENELTKKCYYSVRIDFIEGGVNQRFFSHPCQPGKIFSLRFPISELNQLKPNKITVRFSVSLVDVSKFRAPSDDNCNKKEDVTNTSIGDHDHDDHDQTEKIQTMKKCQELVEFENWLVEVVKLPQYLNQFKKHALADLNVIRLVSGQDLIDAGVTKIGHKLRFLKHIAILKNQDENDVNL